MFPEYIGVYFWLEISNPREWMFMIATVAILAASYGDMLPFPRASRTDTLQAGAYTLIAVVLMSTGLYLVFAGLTSSTATITPLYHQVSTVVAGLLAVCGAVVMSRETFDTPR